MCGPCRLQLDHRGSQGLSGPNKQRWTSSLEAVKITAPPLVESLTAVAMQRPLQLQYVEITAGIEALVEDYKGLMDQPAEPKFKASFCCVVVSPS